MSKAHLRMALHDVSEKIETKPFASCCPAAPLFYSPHYPLI
jgi:hypothetical protein